MRFLRNKFVIGLLCIVIGVTAGFVLLPKAQNADTVMTNVVRLKQDVNTGTLLEQKMMEIISVAADTVPSGAASTIESYVGKYASSQLYKGDIITGNKVRDTLVDPVAAAAAKGKQLVSVTLPNLSSGVSGTLQPGDVVSVMVTSKVMQINQNPQSTGYVDENGNYVSAPVNTLISSIAQETQTIIPEELRYLEICRVTSADGTDALVNDQKDEEHPNRLPVTITFYATEKQALKLAEVEQNGELHITFLARGADADLYIPRAERVLASELLPETDKESGETGTILPSVTTVPVTIPSVGTVDFSRPEVGE